MSRIRLIPVDRATVAPLTISERLRSQLVYFASHPERAGVPTLGEGEYFIHHDDVSTLLAEGVIRLVSPLDTANTTEVELSEEQEALLEWFRANNVQHVRVVIGG
jgi:hypothetical protein